MLIPPFIYRSGGFADGQGLAAALSLGAEGINMGTRFMCTIEAPIHQNIKESIVKAQETDTELVLRRWKNTSRMFSNKVARDAIKIERESPTGKFEEVAPYVSGKRGREVFLNGDPEHGVSGHLHLQELKLTFYETGLDSRSSHRPDSRHSKLRRPHLTH